VLTRWRSVGERGRRDSSVASERMVRIVVVDAVDVAALLVVRLFGSCRGRCSVDFMLI